MPFATPVLTSAPVPGTDGGTVRIPLNLASLHLGISVLITAAYTLGAGTVAVHEDGWGAVIQSVALVPSGTQRNIDLPGYDALLRAQLISGGPIPSVSNVLGSTAGAANTGRLVLRLYPTSADVPNPLAAAFDGRGLAQYDLLITFAPLASVITGVTVSAISYSVTITEFLADGVPPLAGRVNIPFRSASVVNPIGTTPLAVNMLQGGMLRNVLLIARDDVGLAGVRSDALLSTVTIQANGSRRLIQDIPWYVLRDLGQEVRDFELPTGVALLTPDFLSMVTGETMIPATGGNGLSSLELILTPAATCYVTVDTEFWRLV